MGFLNDLGRLISGSVGNNAENKEEDVRRVRDSFENIDLFKEEEKERDYEGNSLGIITRGLDSKIKDFQERNDLKVDGLLIPGGETENALVSKKKERELETGLFSEPILSIKKEKPIKVNKERVAERMEEYLLAQVIPPKPKEKPFSKHLSISEGKEKQENYSILTDTTGKIIKEKHSKNITHTIDTFFPDLKNEEGKYTNGKVSKNAIDRGGPTNIGINENTLREYRNWKKSLGKELPEYFTDDVKKVTPRLARTIYDEMYYKRYHIDKVANKDVAENMLDIAINQGPTRGIKWYQNALNKELNIVLDTDGVLGPTTREALIKAEKEGVLKGVHDKVLEKRIKAYKQLAKDSTQAGFLEGWLDRVEKFRWE